MWTSTEKVTTLRYGNEEQSFKSITIEDVKNFARRFGLTMWFTKDEQGREIEPSNLGEYEGSVLTIIPDSKVSKSQFHYGSIQMEVSK